MAYTHQHSCPQCFTWGSCARNAALEGNHACCTVHISVLYAGIPIKAPFVDGLSGTVYAMEATIKALISNLPAERKANPTVAILGGGGYIGSRLVTVLATAAPDTTASQTKALMSTQQPTGSFRGSNLARLLFRSESANDDGKEGTTAAITLRDKQPAASALKQIIALDTRYTGNRHSKAGVLYTAEPQDLEAADVVLVITRNGDDVAGYVKHAQPGQVRAGNVQLDGCGAEEHTQSNSGNSLVDGNSVRC